VNRRAFVATGAVALAGCAVRRGKMLDSAFGPLSVRPTPSPAQLAWQRDELAMFCHFGVNTFTDREWGDGTESPAIFNPTAFDARQWARAARAGGFRSMILTAKHHDGFCLWPTATTRHSVASSPWRNGAGDVVREFVDACRAEGLRPGLYLSPWDRNNPAYGDSPRYNDLYCDQLTELLTHYGPLAEVWFDGANGEGPNGKKQVYDWPRFWGLVRRLQPDAVMFSDAGPDIRWCGNERGVAGEPNWSIVDPTVVTFPGQSGPEVIPALQHGSTVGTVWRPAEADVSIRPGWFYHAAEDEKVRTVDSLVDLYLSSVGRNSKLLLNVPPTRQGLLHDVDAQRLAAFRDARDAAFGHDLGAGATPSWTTPSPGTIELELELANPARVSAVRIEESIAYGQGVASHAVSVSDANPMVWFDVASGTTVGYARIHRLRQPVSARRVRVTLRDSVAEIRGASISVFGET
jgi:alpha-L-fucosidase